MLASDPVLPDVAPVEPVAGAALGPRQRRGRLVATGAALVVAGAGLAAWSVGSDAVVTAARAVLVVAGLLVVVAGLSRLARGLLGRPVDVVLWLGVAWLVLVLGAAALAPWLPLGNHDDSVAGLSEPIFAAPDLGSEHPLGTNNYGLDVLSRAIHGARTSILVALLAVLVGTTVGGLVGMVSGFLRGTTDRVVGVLSNALLAVPPLILLIALGAVLEPSVRSIAFALSLLTIPSMVRLARASTIAVAEREFVLAARAMGASRWRLLRREVLPNVVLPVLSLAVVMISVLVVAEASLSFLGIGIEQPAPTWGNMIAEGQGGVMEEHPYLVVVPAVCLFLTVFSFNLLGERAQKAWDPRSAKL
ncbi:ABC transporter permease [Nocardioides sp. cx-173]|uniref:ABC transporter permease n=1 Tax=Nocardioides sp. cx-173 TaxID=2898796 RepID=UPI001E550984|nr:ABC transporter permease [Nocardioides sp. cx-173]MCD4523566.1 ABC transporter permease [Nocardioides sp. cx-173]UGB42098.1 ABC transporter permease [Nocardioides sp. cx-173]